MKLTSSAFAEGQMIPKRYSRDGEDVNPPLSIQGVPEKAKSLTLIVDDPDAPGRTFNHWILFNMLPDTEELTEGARPPMALQGKNDWGEASYGGPQPPSGAHRYFFKLFALDAILSLEPGAKRAEVEKAMQGHILEEAKLMGQFPSPQVAAQAR